MGSTWKWILRSCFVAARGNCLELLLSSTVNAQQSIRKQGKRGKRGEGWKNTELQHTFPQKRGAHTSLSKSVDLKYSCTNYCYSPGSPVGFLSSLREDSW